MEIDAVKIQTATVDDVTPLGFAKVLIWVSSVQTQSSAELAFIAMREHVLLL